MMVWLYLLGAVAAEVVWAIALKESDNFTRLWPTVISVAALAGDFFFLAYTFKILPISVVYPIWVGLGAIGVALYGIFVYGESAQVIKLVSIMLIICGVVGLKIFSPQ